MNESLEIKLFSFARGLGVLAAPQLQRLQKRGEIAQARAALSELAETRLLDYTVMSKHGGASVDGCEPNRVSVAALSVLREELSYHDSMLDLMLVMQGLGSYPLQLGGSERQCADILPEVISGASIAAYALTEPTAGSNLDEIATRARRDGNNWILDGEKVFISNAPIADFFTVLARTSAKPGARDTRGLSMFLVRGDATGLETEAFSLLAAHPIGAVRFDGTPAELIGEVGEGLDMALATLGTFRTTVAAAANGFSRRALDESRQHLSTRKQFGKPLGANQGLRFDLAEMDTRLRAAQLLVREAAQLVDSCSPDAAAAVARAKLFATEQASWICDRAVQHHGGLGVKRGVKVEELFRDVRALRIYEGASEIQKLILGKLVLERDGPTPI